MTVHAGNMLELLILIIPNCQLKCSKPEAVLQRINELEVSYTENHELLTSIWYPINLSMPYQGVDFNGGLDDQVAIVVPQIMNWDWSGIVIKVVEFTLLISSPSTRSRSVAGILTFEIFIVKNEDCICGSTSLV